MTQQNNGQLGDWATKCAQAKPIEIATKIACLELFRQGNGYRRAAQMLGLKQYTVRDWLRRFKSGDVSWSTRDRQAYFGCAEAKDLVQYRHGHFPIRFRARCSPSLTQHTESCTIFATSPRKDLTMYNFKANEDILPLSEFRSNLAGYITQTRETERPIIVSAFKLVNMSQILKSAIDPEQRF